MLYLDFAQNKEDFILEEEEKYPRIIKKILYIFRKITGHLVKYQIDGKNVVLISKFNTRIAKKMEKVFKIDVTKNVCICERLANDNTFINYLKSNNLNIMDGKWLFKYLITKISKYICNKIGYLSENR